MAERSQPDSLVVSETTEPVVSEPTLELKLKVLEQRLTIKMIVGFTAAGTLGHLNIPSSVTVGAVLLVAGKAVLTRVSI